MISLREASVEVRSMVKLGCAWSITGDGTKVDDDVVVVAAGTLGARGGGLGAWTIGGRDGGKTGAVVDEYWGG